jgi:hypothetical protein
MFRIEIFVEDKKLPAFLHAAAGLVVSMSPPAPVVNVKEPNGGGMVAASGGTISELFYSELKKKRMHEFTTNEAKSILNAIGGNDRSYNYVTKVLQEAKHIKLLHRGKWKVL